MLSDPVLMGKVIDSFEEHAREHAPTCVAGPEARGFIFGPLLAMRLNVPFVPIRKPGKLPHKTVSVSTRWSTAPTNSRCTRTRWAQGSGDPRGRPPGHRWDRGGRCLLDLQGRGRDGGRLFLIERRG